MEQPWSGLAAALACRPAGEFALGGPGESTMLGGESATEGQRGRQRTVAATRNDRPFGGSFWCAYVANTSLMLGVSLLFRYSDFVEHLGGSEYELGWIVGIGMVGAVVMRLVIGLCVDRYGAANTWIVSELGVILSLVGHLGVDGVNSLEIYGLRMLYATSLAGAFGSSIVFVSLRAPADQIGATIGALGSSGFIGMALGPMLGDYLFSLPGGGRTPVDRMFYCALVAACVALAATVVGRWTAGPHRRTSRRPVPLGWLLRRYHPGPVLLIGVAMGMGINMPFSFLRPFADRLGVDGTQTFFVMYSAVAFLSRVLGRKLPDRWGVRNTVTTGMIFLCLHLLAFLLVRSERGLMLPAVLGGIAHAFVFPAAMTAASTSFPNRYRGLATAWMLTMFDAGSMLGQPAIGSLLHFAERFGLPPYPTMFVVITTAIALVTSWYVWREPRGKDARRRHRPTPRIDERASASRNTRGDVSTECDPVATSFDSAL